VVGRDLASVHPPTPPRSANFLGTIAPPRTASRSSRPHRHAGSFWCGRRPVRGGTRVKAGVVGRTVEPPGATRSSPSCWWRSRRSHWPLPGRSGQPLAAAHRDLGPTEPARRNEYYDVLYRARGMVLLDREGRSKVNDEARRRSTCRGRSARRRAGAGRMARPACGELVRRSTHRRAHRRGEPTADTRAGRRPARSSPCATTPSCGRSSASWLPARARRLPNAQATRPPTSCTPWSR
jgi:hypothetical protein